MINFRYHLASLIAVFLALAVGVVMGSTVIDRAIVDGLRDRVSTVEAKSDATKAENERLQSELERAQGYVESSAPFAVEDRLRGLPVQLFAPRGANSDQVQRSVKLLQSAGANLSSFLWVEPSWALVDDSARSRLADAASIPLGSPRTMRAAAWKAIAAELAALNPAPAAPTPPDPLATTTSPTPPPDTIERLTAAGFFARQSVDGPVSPLVPGRAARVILITATRDQIPVPNLLATEANAMVAASLDTVAAEDFAEVAEGPSRGGTLAPVLTDPALAAAVSTVDNFESTEGQVAAVIALQQLARGTVGHYGYGNGADAHFPVVEST